MPEGPEIRLAADGIARAVEGRVVQDVWFAFPHLKRWEKQLRGGRVRAVEPRGKALLVRFSGGLNLYSHNQLYGKWFLTDNGELPSTGRQLRVAIHTSKSSALLYSASEIEVLRDKELERHAYLQRLGPDVLDPSVRPVAVRTRLEDRRFSGRSLGALLLDQSFLGGIGNYLRSEILFVSGLDARRRPRDLDSDERKRFARSALTISRRAYRTRGITNDPAIVRRLRKAKLRRGELRHFVFGRDGSPCYRCETEIVKEQVAGRRLYSCGACQG